MPGSSSDSDGTPKAASSSSSEEEEDKPSPSTTAAATHHSSDESTSDGVLVEIPGQEHSSEDVGREETFEDAPDELGERGVDLGESIAMVDLAETSSPEHLARVRSDCRKYQEEMEVFGRQAAVLRRQLRKMMDQQAVEQIFPVDSEGGGEEDMDLVSRMPLHMILGDCSNIADHLKGILNEKLQSEAMIRELHAILYSKDQEIEDLSAGVAESAISHDVILCYLHSIRSAWMEYYLNETEQFRLCLAKIRPRLMVSDSDVPGYVFRVACEELLESKRKEANFEVTVSHLEEKNRKIAEQVDRLKEGCDEAKAEASKSKMDLEQAENRLAAAKEKLSIAVSKGKSLVQHRDSLKQSLAEKTSELEKCLLQLQKKSTDLETMEATVEELKQTLAEKTSEFEKCMQDLQQKSYGLETMEASTEELKQSLAEKTNNLEKCLHELQQKSGALVAAEAISEELNDKRSLIDSLQGSISHKENILLEIEEVMSQNDMPQDFHSLDVVDKVRWFVDQKQISEALLLERHKLKDALSAIELLEGGQPGDIESQVHQLIESYTQAKDIIAKMQDELDVSRMAAFSHESELSELHTEIDRLNASLLEEKQENDSVQAAVEEIRSKYEDVAERLSIFSSENDELKKILVELSGSTLEEHTSRDIHIMTENCISRIREKINSSYGREQLERMQSLLYVRDQELMLYEKFLEEEMINRSELMNLSAELGKASEEIIGLKDEKSLLQKELERLEEKSALLREKLSMAVKKGKGLVQEREGFKISLEEKNAEIEKLKGDLQLQESAIAEYKEKINSLSSYPEHVQKIEADILLLKDQKDQIEQFLQETDCTLQRLIGSIEQIVLPTDKSFDKPVEKINWIAEYIHKSEVAKAFAEKELEKVKEDTLLQGRSLSDAYEAIKSLEDKLSEAHMHISVIAEEKINLQLGKNSVEEELEKIKEESFMQASKVEHAYATIQTLEESLSKADEKISVLDSEKSQLESTSKQEIVMLNAKLAECMEELTRTHGSFENKSAELVNQLGNLQIFMKEGLISFMTKEFIQKLESLRSMDLSLQDMHKQFSAKGYSSHTEMEEHFEMLQASPLPKFEEFVESMVVKHKLTTADLDGAPSFTKTIEELHAQAELVGDSFKEFSRFMNYHIALTYRAMQAARDEFLHLLDLNESLKLTTNSLETEEQAKESKITSLQKDLMLLLSACSNATQELQIEFQEVLNLDSGSELQKSNSSLDTKSKEEASGGQIKEGRSDENAKAAESLLSAARRVRVEFHQLLNAKKVLLASIDNLENKVKQAELTAENASQDRRLSQERVSELEGDLVMLGSVCSDLRDQVKDYEAKEDMLRNKEAELALLQSTFTAKGRGVSDSLLSEDQVEILFDKISEIEIPFKVLQSTGQNVQFSSPLEKLYYVLDSVSELQHRVDSVISEKESMELSLESHVHEIEHLKEVIQTINSSNDDLEAKKTELTELMLDLERIIQRLGENDPFEDKKTLSTKGLLSLLDQLTVALSKEYEKSKSQIRELGTKLQAKENMVGELSTKVNSLEDSLARLSQPESLKERTAFEASPTMGSEISEIEDMGPLGKNSISPMPAAAHVRTMRKGSSDHLVLSIDSDSEQLISTQETDEKGHVFKSLSTSGLIPKRGKLIAERIDGIWVSGGRVLMSRPGARLGLIAYWLLLHIWVLGTIL